MSTKSKKRSKKKSSFESKNGSVERASKVQAPPPIDRANPPKRADLPPGVEVCTYCTGKCCRYISVSIDEPTTWDDFDTIRWYVTHHEISVYVEKGSWYVMVHRDCRHLMSDNRCGVYLDRPQICRDHSSADCEYEDDYDYQLIFEHDRQVWEYAEARLGPRAVPKLSMPFEADRTGLIAIGLL